MDRVDFARSLGLFYPVVGEQHQLVFDGWACFVFTSAAGPTRQGGVVYFSTGEELTPEVGRDSKSGSGDAENDSTQLACEVVRTRTRAGPALQCLFDRVAGFGLDVSRATGLLESTDPTFAAADDEEGTPEPLPPFVQLEFGPIALRFYESGRTPAAGEGSVAFLRASLAELLRSSHAVPADARRGGDGARARAHLDALLEEVLPADAPAGFVGAARRLGPTYQLRTLLAQLGHAQVDGRTAEQLVQEALRALAQAHAANLVALDAKREAAAALADEIAETKERMLRRCRARLEQRASSGGQMAAARAEPPAGGAGPAAAQCEQDFAQLSERARQACLLQLQPARMALPS